MYFILHTLDSSETPTPVDTDSNRNSTPSTQEAATEVKTRRKSDPTWRYCTQFTEGGKKRSNACSVMMYLQEEGSIVSRSI
jgi:hypothetical protein